MSEATGVVNLIALTSKAVSMTMVFLKARLQRKLVRLRRKAPKPLQRRRSQRNLQRSRKKRFLKRKPKKSFLALASMTSLLLELSARKLRPERLKASRVLMCSKSERLKLRSKTLSTRRTSLPTLSRAATSFSDLPALLRKTTITLEVVAPAGVAEEAEEVGQTE